MIPACAFTLLAALHILPELLSCWGLGTASALEYVGWGTESAVLWAAVLVISKGPMRYIAAWGVAEGLSRATCRVALPLDRAPVLQPDQSLCDAALGMPISLMSLAAALTLAAFLNSHNR